MNIRELADALSLSKSTVAYALRGDPRVRESTRRRILERARELGYQPNPLASAFLTQARSKGREKTARGNLAYLLPLAEGRRLEELYLSQQLLYTGAERRAEELGYRLEPLCAKGIRGSRLTQILHARGVIGVIAAPLMRDVGHYTLDWSQFAAVTAGYSMSRPQLHRISHNHGRGMRTLLRVCHRRGYRRLGLVLYSGGNLRSERAWSAAWVDVRDASPAMAGMTPFIHEEIWPDLDKIREWRRRERPDLVIFQNHPPFEMPDDVLEGLPVAVLDREPQSPYPGIDQQHERCGASMIDLLSMQITHHERGIPANPMLTLIDGEWIDRPRLPPR
jgi:DNA-binding LacI/PurR family transcriptional regulator